MTARKNLRRARAARFCSAPRAFVLACVLMSAIPACVGAQIMSDANQQLFMPFPYEAKGAEAKSVLQDISRNVGIPMIIDAKISGNVDLSNARGSVRDALDTVTGQTNSVWWFDGAAVHVEPASALVSRLIGLNGITFGQLQAQIKAIGLEDPQYPLRASPNAEMVRIVAPAGFADAVETLANHMAELRHAEGPERIGRPVILRGRSPHTAAAETQ